MSDKYVIEFGDEELLMGEHSYRRIKGTNTLMCDDDIKSLTPAESKEEKKTINDIKPWQDYWFIDDTGSCQLSSWLDDASDHWRRECGNAFLTEKEAMFYKKRQEVTNTLRQYAEPFDAPWYGVRKHYYLTAYLNSHMVAVTFGFASKIAGFTFATETDAKKVIDEVGEVDLLKYYFMVEE